MFGQGEVDIGVQWGRAMLLEVVDRDAATEPWGCNRSVALDELHFGCPFSRSNRIEMRA